MWATVTLKPLLEIKKDGGHAAYVLARTFALNDRSTFRHEGALSEPLIERIRHGVVRELVCIGKVGLSEHFEALVLVCDRTARHSQLCPGSASAPRLLTRLQAVESKSCALTEISLTDCDWPERVGASRLIKAVASSGCAPMLEKLDGIARPSLFLTQPH